MEYIPDELYQKILTAVPITCVDMVIKDGDSFLLAKRKNQPAQGQWFLPGGRILKNEKLEDAVLRKMRQETGMDGTVERMLGIDETMFPDGPYGESVHTINIVFLITPATPKNAVVLDEQNDEYQWYTQIDQAWHPYVKKFLEIAGCVKTA